MFYTVGLPYLQVWNLWIQPTADQKYLGEKNSIMFQKAKLEFTLYQQLFYIALQCIYTYLHSIYNILGITSNLKIIQSMQEYVQRLYANTIQFYIRDLSILGFWCLQGGGLGSVLEPIPCGYWGTTVFVISPYSYVQFGRAKGLCYYHFNNKW